MLKTILIPVYLLLFLANFVPDARADESIRTCGPQAEKASSEQRKYSLEAQVDRPLYFHTIACGLRHRYKELCAMEMVSFDTSGSVFDYYTLEAISVTKAYYWLDENDPTASILAFSSKEAAEEFRAAKTSGSVLDYTTLTEKISK